MSKKASRLLKSALSVLVIAILLCTSGFSAIAEEEQRTITPYALETPYEYAFYDLHYVDKPFATSYNFGGWQPYENCEWNYVVPDRDTVDPLYYVAKYTYNVQEPAPLSDPYLTYSRTIQTAGSYTLTIREDFLDSYPSEKIPNCYLMAITIAGYSTTDCDGSGIWNV